MTEFISDLPFVTPKTYGVKGTKYKNFDIDSMFPAGSNLNFFQSRKANTWSLLQFNIFRRLLNVILRVIGYYREIPADVRDGLHNGFRQLGLVFYGEQNSAPGSREETQNEKQKADPVFTSRHVITKPKSHDPVVDYRLAQIEDIIDEDSSKPSSLWVGLPWILMVNLSALQSIVLSSWSALSSRLIQRRSYTFMPLYFRRGQKKKSSVKLPDWERWVKYINDTVVYCPNHIGTSVEYEPFVERPPPPRPKTRTLATGKIVTPSIRELETYQNTLKAHEEAEIEHEKNQVNRLVDEISTFIVSSAVTRVDKLSIFEKTGTVEKNLDQLARVVERKVESMKNIRPRSIFLHTFVGERGRSEQSGAHSNGEMIATTKRGELASGSSSYHLATRTLHEEPVESNPDSLGVYILQKIPDLDEILTCARSLAEQIMNNRIHVQELDDEKISGLVRKRFLGTSNKVDLFITPQCSNSLGYPLYGLKGSLIYDEQRHDITTEQLLANAFTAYNEDCIQAIDQMYS